MNRNQRKQYALKRKMHHDKATRDSQIKGLKRIIIHNAYRASEVEDNLESAGVKPDLIYFPEKSTETHFYVANTGDLHAVNSRGVTRLIRDINLHETLCEVLGKDLELKINHYQKSPSRASKRFEDFAFSLVHEVFEHVDRNKVQEKGEISILVGPHESLKISNKQVYTAKNDFLNYTILNIEGNTVIAFDYIFADQARNVLSQAYLTINADFDGLDVNVFHYGKVGLLSPGAEVGQICIPTGALEEDRVIQGDCRMSPIHNQLDPMFDSETADFFRKMMDAEISYGTTVNTTSVLKQTTETLQRDLEAKGKFLDMEWSTMAGLDHGYKSCYPCLGQIKYFFAGVGSDNPLEGKTLGDTRYPRDIEIRVASTFLNMIKQI